MYEYKAEVINVVNGDTIDVMIDLGLNAYRAERVRLARVDVPNIRGKEKEKGLKAKEFVENVLKDYPFVIIRTEKGKHGKYVAEVYFPDVKGDGTYSLKRSLSNLLLETGRAKLYQE